MAFYPKVREPRASGDYEDFSITPYCGLCRRIIVSNASCHILETDNAGTVYKTIAFSVGGDDLCCDPKKIWERAHDGCPVHADCFTFFEKHCQRPIDRFVLDRIWIEGICQLPWPEAPCLWLDETDDLFSTTGVANMMTDGDDQDGLGQFRSLIKGLKKLPHEILLMIYRESEDHVLWRYGTILDFAYHVSSLDTSEDRPSMPLNEIAAWERGEMPTVVTAAMHYELPILRITIDARGLRSIERLASMPLPTIERKNNRRFIVTHDSVARAITMNFRFGYAQLDLNKARRNALQVWDTPTPPDDSMCTMHANPVRGPGTCFYTVPLDQATGLAIFFDKGRPLGIHKLTAADPTYKAALSRMSPEKDVEMVYMPIAAGDHIVAFGVRYKAGQTSIAKDPCCFIFRTKLMGDIIVGTAIEGPYTDFYLASNIDGNTSPLTIVYFAKKMQRFTAIGGYAVNQPTATTPEERFCDLSRLSNPFRFSFFSIAPLENVVHIRVYYFVSQPEQIFCGMILTYRNGGKRALGQCSIGFTPYIDYENPVFLCIRRIRRGLIFSERFKPTLQVQATNDYNHGHGDPEWKCLPLRGTLQMWSLFDRCDYKVVGAGEVEEEL